MSHIPEEIIENIIFFLPMKAKVKVMRVSQAWKRIAESSLSKQDTLAVVTERPYASRFFSCCFKCHVTLVPHQNVLCGESMLSINRRKIHLKRYCPNIKVLVIEDRISGERSPVCFFVPFISSNDVHQGWKCCRSLRRHWNRCRSRDCR